MAFQGIQAAATRAFCAVLVALAPVCAGLAQEPPAKPGARYALVIGNSTYSALSPVTSSTKDAGLMASALADAGFQVTLVYDMRMPDFLPKDQDPFLQKLRPGDTCVFYYSGYAVQVTDDDNYLLPVNFDPNSSRPMHERAYLLTRFQQELERRRVGLKIFILEAPRRINVAIRGASPGLLYPEVTESSQTLWAFAAQPGQLVASPPGDSFGLFTKSVAENLRKPGLRLREVFDRAKQAVGENTSQQQIPFEYDNLVGNDFFFHAPAKPVVPPPVLTAAPAPAAPKTNAVPAGFPLTNRNDREEYVWIPPGKFMMGCVGSDSRCKPDEKPQHPVEIKKGFWMGRTEVEVIAYRRYVDSSGKKVRMPRAPLEAKGWKITNYPMMQVSWEDARDYCQWAGGRLPTEAEWEYAARAGAANQVYPMNDENSREKANFYGKKGNDRFEYVAPVKSFDPNPFGLFDMAGNVWEWVNDFYSPDYFRTSPAIDPAGPKDGKEHVIRGGSFDSDPKEHLRLSFRRSAGKAADNIGMRCVLDDTPETHRLLGR